METNSKLADQVENIQMRIKKIENDITKYKKEALMKKQKKDDRGAVAALRRAKMVEKELTKLEG